MEAKERRAPHSHINLNLMLDIRKRLDLSFMLISHDISVVGYLWERVAATHRGGVVESALGTDLQPAARATRGVRSRPSRTRTRV